MCGCCYRVSTGVSTGTVLFDTLRHHRQRLVSPGASSNKSSERTVPRDKTRLCQTEPSPLTHPLTHTFFPLLPASRWPASEAGAGHAPSKRPPVWGPFSFNWRRRGDSNPRTRGYRVNGFRDRRIQPLCHPSAGVTASCGCREYMAESWGFEPQMRLNTAYTISNRAPSTSRPALHQGCRQRCRFLSTSGANAHASIHDCAAARPRESIWTHLVSVNGTSGGSQACTADFTVSLSQDFNRIGSGCHPWPSP